MSEVVASTLRISVRGTAGTLDLAVPPGAEAGGVAEQYAVSLGLAAPPALVTTTGVAVAPRQRLHDAGVGSGDVLVALDPAGPDPGDGGEPIPSPGPGPDPARPTGLVALAATASVAAGLVGVQVADGSVRTAAAVVLAGAALLAVLGARLRAGLGTAHAMAAPALAGTAGFVGVHSDRPGGTLLALTVGGVAAAVAAAVVRAGADRRQEALLRVWLVVSSAVALSAGVALAAGIPERALWAWLFALAVVAARLLPLLVVDVPDETLLEIDRLAVTAWSARERPRGHSRRRVAIRPEGVAELVRRGRDLLVVGTVVVAVAASAAAVLLAQDPGDGVDALGAWLLLLFGGAGLVLTARSYRARVPRFALRLPGAIALVLVAATWLVRVDGASLWWFLGGLAVASLSAVLAAVAVGRGWRSLWWARTTDLLEGAAVALCIAALPVAAGLFELVLQLPS